MEPYPQIVDYNEAVQHPETAFLDPELQQAQIKENALGLPMVLSGGFALTYMLVGPHRKIAVRCFHRHIPAVEQKYSAISQSFRRLGSPYFVGFEFLGQGVRVRRQVFPVVKMDWADGDILGLWLERNHADPAALSRARREFAALAQYLEDQGISHGDIQNGNLIVSPQGIKLVDYDGVYVPGMPVGEGSESGHKHFQHPDRTSRDHGPGVDRFSFIALDLSLAALIEDPSLFRRYSEGGETIIFRANDFTDPMHSEIFDILTKTPVLMESAQRFAEICNGPIGEVPALQEFLAHDRPRSAVAARPQAAPVRPRQDRYIGTYPIVKAADFASVASHVGHRVELIGRIASVEWGVGKGGRRHGRPYLQVTLRRHWRDVVRLTIWSDAGDFPSGFGRDWAGRWVSAVGLVGQPFVTDAFWRPRTYAGIALDDPAQLNFIPAEQAKFRLAHATGAADTDRGGVASTASENPLQARGAARPKNQQIVSRMLGTKSENAAPSPMPAAAKPGAVPASSANDTIIRRLRTRGPRLSEPVVRPAPVVRPQPRPGPPAQGPTGRSPVMTVHPRLPQTVPNVPPPSPDPPSSTWLGGVLRKLGLLD
jgi:hypothetical protein